MKSLDTYAVQPSGKKEYLQNYGYHFSKKAYEWAVSMMRKKDKTPMMPMPKEEVDKMFSKYGFRLENNVAYDAAYVHCMAKADYWGSSIEDEMHLVRFIKDFLDDPDGGEEKAFRHWYSDMVEAGIPISWEDIM